MGWWVGRLGGLVVGRWLGGLVKWVGGLVKWVDGLVGG